jgi:hypothetical protein
MRPEARVTFPAMEVPLMLDVGAAHVPGRAGNILNRRGIRPRALGGNR